MKKLFTLSLLLAAILFAFNSCKTEEEKKNLGSFKVDNVSYTINEATVKGYKSSNPDITNKYVFTFQSLNGDATQRVNLAISFPYNDIGINGTYILYGNSKQLDPWLSHYAETNGKSTHTYNNLVLGKCVVQRTGDKTFKVNFDFKPEAGMKVIGEFLGDATVTE